MFVWTQNFETSIVLGGNGNMGLLVSEDEQVWWDGTGSWDHHLSDQTLEPFEGEYPNYCEVNSIQNPEDR